MNQERIEMNSICIKVDLVTLIIMAELNQGMYMIIKGDGRVDADRSVGCISSSVFGLVNSLQTTVSRLKNILTFIIYVSVLHATEYIFV